MALRPEPSSPRTRNHGKAYTASSPRCWRFERRRPFTPSAQLSARWRRFSVSVGIPAVSWAASDASARCRRVLHHDQPSKPIDSTIAVTTRPAKKAHQDDHTYPTSAAATTAPATAMPSTMTVRRHVHSSGFGSAGLWPFWPFVVGAIRATVDPGGCVETRTFGPPAANWMTSPSETSVGRSIRLPPTNVPLRLCRSFTKNCPPSR